MSAEKKPMFKDAKSAVISITAIILVIALGIVGIDRNNVNRLTKTGKKITTYKEAAYTLIEERFELSSMVGRILVEEGLDDPIGPVVRQWDSEADVEAVSHLYISLDQELDGVLKRYYGQAVYLRMVPYFEEIYRVELSLTTPVEEYNGQVDTYNAMRASFPASLTARRLERGALPRFSIASALKGRP
ncbi:MAG: hypothetical protein QM434_07755 [Spirochaetota bacterium]|nr:hypothetical protein [Spirochaetota bacterium]